MRDVFSDKLKEECGVFGIHNKDNLDISRIIYFGLYALQHRGQESAGIAVYDGNNMNYHKDMGLVSEVFSDSILKKLNGNIGIGHVRYSTNGESYVVNSQPLVIKYKKGTIALAHNGNLINATELKNNLEEQGIIFQTTVDSEVIANIIARHTKQDEDIENAITKTIAEIRGAYALVLMTEDKLIGVRDPMGIRPLSIGKLKDSYVLASETCAFDVIGADYIRDVEPGEIVTIDQNGLKSIKPKGPGCSALCVFEFVYLARTDSIMHDLSVYKARKDAGRILAQEHPVDADIVIGVPDSGTTAAIGYAEESGITYGEGLIKNRYIGRTFIQPTQKVREQGVKLKLNALKYMVEGKNIVMIDDSIVRGTTSKQIVQMLRESGAKKIHMRISSPPVKYPCYFGIDTPSTSQLIGATKTVDEIKELIGVDSLGYISLEGLMKTLSDNNCEYGNDFCKGCFVGKYPLDITNVN